MEIDNRTLSFSQENFSTMLNQARQMADESLDSLQSCRYSVGIVTSPNLDQHDGERFKSFDFEEELSMFEFINEHPNYEAECDIYYKEPNDLSWERSEIGLRLNNEVLHLYY